MDGETLKTLDRMNKKEELCALSHPAFVFFYTDKAHQAWEVAGCDTFKSKSIDKIHRLWDEFVADMPASLHWPFKKVGVPTGHC